MSRSDHEFVSHARTAPQAQTSMRSSMKPFRNVRTQNAHTQNIRTQESLEGEKEGLW